MNTTFDPRSIYFHAQKPTDEGLAPAAIESLINLERWAQTVDALAHPEDQKYFHLLWPRVKQNLLAHFTRDTILILRHTLDCSNN